MSFCHPQCCYQPFGVRKCAFEQYERNKCLQRDLNIPEKYELPALKLDYKYRPFGVPENIIQRYFRKDLEGLMGECRGKYLDEHGVDDNVQGRCTKSRPDPVTGVCCCTDDCPHVYRPHGAKLDAYDRERIDRKRRMTRSATLPRTLNIERMPPGCKAPSQNDTTEWGYICHKGLNEAETWCATCDDGNGNGNDNGNGNGHGNGKENGNGKPSSSHGNGNNGKERKNNNNGAAHGGGSNGSKNKGPPPSPHERRDGLQECGRCCIDYESGESSVKKENKSHSSNNQSNEHKRNAEASKNVKQEKNEEEEEEEAEPVPPKIVPIHILRLERYCKPLYGGCRR